MMELLSPIMLKSIRKTMDRFMVDTVEVYHIGDQVESVFDPTTLTSMPKAGAQVYSGKGRVRPSSGPRENAVGDSVMVMRDVDINLPWNAPQFQRDDLVKVVASEDTDLVDRWFRVTDVVVAGQRATRKCSAIQVQPSRVWNTS